MNLPFIPWWYHPNHNYEGKHRGTYRFWPEIELIDDGE